MPTEPTNEQIRNEFAEYWLLLSNLASNLGIPKKKMEVVYQIARKAYELGRMKKP
jgi:hypothetical protein